MNEFNEYQDSLDQYQDTSMRTEQEAPKTPQQQEAIAENNGLQFSTTHDSDGEIEVDYENTDNTTQPVEGAQPVETSEPAEPSDEEVAEYQDNLITEAGDWVAEKFLGQDPEERRAKRLESQESLRESYRVNVEEATDLGTVVARDGTRAVTSGIEKAAQSAIGFANFAGDFAKTKLGMVEEDDEWNNTDHADYRGSERDLVMSEPRSMAGQMARDLVSFVVLTRQVGGATGLNGVAASQTNMAARGAVEMGIGAVADFINDPSDPNAMAALQEFLPATKDNAILSAFATQDDDDEFTRRLKNSIEGGVMQVAVDGAGVALKGLFKGAEPLLKWLKGHPGKTAADAPPEVVEEAFVALQDGIYHGTYAKEKIVKEGFKASKGEYHPLGGGVYFSSNPDLAKAYGPGILSGEIGGLKIKELSIEDLKQYGIDVNADTQAPDALSKALGGEFDGVRVKGLYDSKPDLDEVVIFDPKKADSVIAPKSKLIAPEGSRPGYEARMEEDVANGGTKSRQDFEPYERAGITTETPMEKVLAEQAADPVATRAPFTPGAPSPRMTDNTVRQISEGGGDVDVIARGVEELEELLKPALRSKDPKVVEEAKARLVKLHMDNTGEKIDMSALEEVVGESGDAAAYIQQVLGNTVAKSYLRDLSNQISGLAGEARQITDTGMDANRQYNLLLDRLKATSKLQIRDASRRGVGLQSLKNKVLGLNETAITKKIEEFDTKIDTLRDRINAGDVDAVEEMKTLTDALVLADGDADMSMSFMNKFFSMTKANFETTLFNSYLSGLVTHERNFLGNGAQVLLKPAQIAMGSVGKPGSKAALSMYSGMWGDLREGFRVARTALAENTPDRISKMEGYNNMNMAQKVENLRASAKTPFENAAANFAAAQYNMLANPWLQGATRLLDASDRGFRVLSARQKLRFDQNMLAMEDGIKFDPKKYDTVWGTKFKDGEITDEALLNWAKSDTFQEDLGENMIKVADMINTIPFAKFVIPFVKTPTNIIKQTAHYVPLAGRAVTFTNSTLGTQFFKEYDQVMRGSDEVAKAVYKGREGTGVMISILGMGLGTQGLITGQGPQDPQKRKLWEEAGNQAHSINIGGIWVSTRFLGPMGILLSAYADLGMVAANAGTYDEFDELRNQLIYSTAGALTDQSFLKGLFTSVEGLNDVLSGKASSQKPGEWQANIMRAMTPYQAALRSLNNTLVPGLREYNNGFEKYFAETLPGAKAFLGAERFSMRTGEPVVNGGYSALNQLVPFSLREMREDPVLGKLVDLGVDMPMEMVDKYKGVELTVQEQNELNKRVAKSGVWEILEERLNSESFAQQVESWRTQQPPIPRAKAEWYQDIKADLSQARNDAIRKYRGEGSPAAIAFNQKIEAIENRDFFGRRGDYYGASQAQELINLAN